MNICWKVLPPLMNIILPSPTVLSLVNFFLSHPRIKRKKFSTTLSLQLEDEQHHRRPLDVESMIRDINLRMEQRKKKKETYIICKFESIAFTPSPRKENFGQTRCYARQRGDGYFL